MLSFCPPPPPQFYPVYAFFRDLMNQESAWGMVCTMYLPPQVIAPVYCMERKAKKITSVLDIQGHPERNFNDDL